MCKVHNVHISMFLIKYIIHNINIFLKYLFLYCNIYYHNGFMEFNKQRFEESDESARNATRKLYARIEPDWTLIDNLDKYGVDFIVYCKGVLKAYIEVEMSNNGFEFGRWKYDAIRLVPRKNHFLDSKDTAEKELKAPIYLCTISKDTKSAVVYNLKDMKEKSKMVRVVNSVPYRLEPVLEDMYSLSTEFVKTYTIDLPVVSTNLRASLMDPYKN